jgi:hypothetical protein
MDSYLSNFPPWMLIASFAVSIIICYAIAASEAGIKGVAIATLIFLIGGISVVIMNALVKKNSGWALLFGALAFIAFFGPAVISQSILLFGPILLVYFIVKKIRYLIMKDAIESGEVISTKKFDYNKY